MLSHRPNPPLRHLSPGRIDALRLKFEKDKHVREQWWKEEQLMNERITWLLSAHALLGSGYAWLKYRIAEILYATLTSNVPERLNVFFFYDTPNNLTYARRLEELSFAVLCVGLAVSAFALLGIIAAICAQASLAKQNPLVKLGVNKYTTMAGRATALSLPFLCITAWTLSHYLL